MNIVFHNNMYTDGFSLKQVNNVKKKIKRLSPKLRLFLVTLPVGKQGILEIYWYPELLQKVYRNYDGDMIVIGLAKTREEAFELVEQIIRDVGWQDGSIPVLNYFEERA